MTLTPQLVRTGLAIGRHARASAAELRAFQDARLRRLLCHAYESVPFYRKLFDRHRLHPRHIRGTVDLDLIPTVTKQELRAHPAANLVAKGLDPDRLLTVRTSGSSGEPFVIRRTLPEQSLQHLLQLRALSQLGLRIGDRMATVCMLRQPDLRDAKIMGRALQATRIKQRLKIDGLQQPGAIVEQLRCYRPDVITGIPGMLCRVADYLLTHGCKGLAPRVVIVGGEVLTPVMRHNLSRGFGAPVSETYASHEFPLLGWQCADNGVFHTCDDGVILEVLHEGRPAEPGERGEVLVTNLHAYAMPFIRYRLADIATRGDQHCGCGQPFSTIRSIEGRMIDYFTLTNGRQVHPYQILEKVMPGTEVWIRQYQLVQDRADSIVMRVVLNHVPAAEASEKIVRAVTPLLGPGIEFQVMVVDDIPLEPSGKLRYARSLVQSAYDEVTTSLART